MKEIIVRIVCCISIILVVAASGCVAPPKENATSSKNGNIVNPNQPGTLTSPTPNYVTDVTPFVTTGTLTSGSRTTPPTPTPGDLYCRIYSTTNTYAYNKTAIAFNLQNPPMLINYTVKPSNVTIHKVYDSKIVGEGEKVLTIDTYSPISVFVITVLSKTTGEVYLEDGFGTQKYTTYLNRTLKVLKRDDMQIEFSGNNITATAMVWVRPEGNFNDTTQFNKSTDCAYLSSNPRDTLPFVTATPTPTWTG
ncbi:MAG: hypothetical protein WC294_04190 [Methanoregula sp.]|jgi:hypothetical protein